VKAVALSKKSAKWILFLGTLSSLILFLILTVDTHRQVGVLMNADNLSTEVILAKSWRKTPQQNLQDGEIEATFCKTQSDM
jgi:hypothetical protein